MVRPSMPGSPSHVVAHRRANRTVGPAGPAADEIQESRVKKIIRVAALGGAVALALAACGSAPEDDTTTPGADGTTAASVDFKACMVSDAGGFDDKSFNQAGFEGLMKAVDE